MKLSLTLHQISKAYQSVPVIQGFSLSLTAPDICCLMAPSGTGKTTLFRILMGLEVPDSGSFTIEALDDASKSRRTLKPEECRISAVFQEDRLIEHMTPLENAALTLPGPMDRAFLYREFSRLLPEECLDRPVSTLSGGMRRRCALLRALLAPFDLLVLDEPFTGLDEASKKEAIRCLLEKTDGRLVLIATHNPEDAGLLGGHIYSFDSFTFPEPDL